MQHPLPTERICPGQLVTVSAPLGTERQITEANTTDTSGAATTSQMQTHQDTLVIQDWSPDQDFLDWLEAQQPQQQD